MCATRSKQYTDRDGGFMRKTDIFFTLRKKMFIAAGAAAFAALWVLLWFMFPMEWYSVFFASAAGSYVTLSLLSLAVSCIFIWLFSLITKLNLSFILFNICSLVIQVSLFFLYAAYRYEKPFLPIIAAVIHAAVCTILLLLSREYPPKTVKRTNTKKPPINTAAKIAFGAAYSAVSDIVYIFLAYKIAFVFYG